MLRHDCSQHNRTTCRIRYENHFWTTLLAQPLLLKEKNILRVGAGVNDVGLGIVCSVRSAEK